VGQISSERHRAKANDTVSSGSQGQLSHGKTVWQRPFAFSPDRTLSPLTWESGIHVIYVILLNLSEIQVNINGYAICPDCGAYFNCGPGGAASQSHA